MLFEKAQKRCDLSIFTGINGNTLYPLTQFIKVYGKREHIQENWAPHDGDPTGFEGKGLNGYRRCQGGYRTCQPVLFRISKNRRGNIQENKT